MTELGTARLTPAEAADLNRRFEVAEPEAILGWALERFHPRIALASSFGAEDAALIDLLWRLDRRIRVFMLDTLRLHTETYAVVDEVRQRYGIEVEILYPDLEAVDRMVREKGYNCFYESVANRQHCCGVRKVEPLERALAGLDAWITGLRRDQATTRAGVAKIEIDDVHGGIVKLNPLSDWSSERVWDYIRTNDVPYNRLHDQGFPTIGCAPCTRAIQPGEDLRAGRWWWELDAAHKECGIHAGSVPATLSVSFESQAPHAP